MLVLFLSGILFCTTSCVTHYGPSTPRPKTLPKTLVQQEYENYVNYRAQLRQAVIDKKMSNPEADYLERQAYNRFLEFEARERNRQLTREARKLIENTIESTQK